MILIDRFNSKVSTGDCHEWTAALDGGGYGMFQMCRGVTIRAHVLAYILHYKEDPTGQVVRHSCDNRKCCNPEHLSVGTYRDNTQDAVTRGRLAAGTSHGNAVFTEEMILAIRLDNRLHWKIAEDYGVIRSTVSRLKARVTYVTH